MALQVALFENGTCAAKAVFSTASATSQAFKLISKRHSDSKASNDGSVTWGNLHAPVRWPRAKAARASRDHAAPWPRVGQSSQKNGTGRPEQIAAEAAQQRRAK